MLINDKNWVEKTDWLLIGFFWLEHLMYWLENKKSGPESISQFIIIAEIRQFRFSNIEKDFTTTKANPSIHYCFYFKESSKGEFRIFLLVPALVVQVRRKSSRWA